MGKRKLIALRFLSFLCLSECCVAVPHGARGISMQFLKLWYFLIIVNISHDVAHMVFTYYQKTILTST